MIFYCAELDRIALLTVDFDPWTGEQLLRTVDYALWVLVALGLYQAAVWVFRGVRAVVRRVRR